MEQHGHSEPLLAGPILYARGSDAECCRLSALVVLAGGEAPPPLRPQDGTPVEAWQANSYYGHTVWIYDFELPAIPDAAYELAGVCHNVAADMTGDVRLAFVSCNGQEHGDEARGAHGRDVMWRRLLREHRQRPVSLLLHGGDQLYADEAVETHPELRRWNRADDDEKLDIALDGAMREAMRRYFFERYLATLCQPAAALLYASVPSMMIWDDHDICDGWGSHMRGLQESAVGEALFEIAREAFVTFQLGGSSDRLPSICLDPSGRTLTCFSRFPGFSVLLPDLRSERTPARIMGDAGWGAVEKAFDGLPENERRLVVSSVPTLGPRLDLIEMLLGIVPHAIDFEDDLRDQWQSHAHREEWRRWLGLLERQSEPGRPVTVVSGEIHLAALASLEFRNGGTLRQLTASGITHPAPPRAFAAGLTRLSMVPQVPVEGCRVRFSTLPGTGRRYVCERNFLTIERRAADRWSAAWELEETGRTPSLAI